MLCDGIFDCVKFALCVKIFTRHSVFISGISDEKWWCKKISDSNLQVVYISWVKTLYTGLIIKIAEKVKYLACKGH